MYRYISNVILICTQGANRIKPEWSEKKIRGHISFGKRGSGEVQCVALCDLPMFVSVSLGGKELWPLCGLPVALMESQFVEPKNTRCFTFNGSP